MTTSRIAAQGRSFTVEWAVTMTGSMPAREFFLGLDEVEQAKILALFNRFAEHGIISNKQKFKKLEPGLLEFKSFQIRMLGNFKPGKRFIVALGLKKKDDRHKPKDLQKAHDILAEHDRREQKLAKKGRR